MDEEVQAIIIDNGSHYIRAGFAGDDAPRVIIDAKPGRPISYGVVNNWQGLETLWTEVFSQLGVNASNHAVLFTSPYLMTKADHEKLAMTMFGKFKTPATFVTIPAVLSLQHGDKTTGVVVDVGETQAAVVPIHEGVPIPHAMVTTNITGQALTNYMRELLDGESYKIPLSDLEKVEEAKIRTCFVALDFDKEVEAVSPYGKAVMELADGTAVHPGKCRAQTPEALFNPATMKKEGFSIQEAIVKAIEKCDSKLHKELYGNIVLAGGTTLFSGLVSRLEKELAKAPPSFKAKITAPPERKYSAWIGGSALASLSSFQMRWISKEEYDKDSTVILEKCPHYEGR